GGDSLQTCQVAFTEDGPAGRQSLDCLGRALSQLGWSGQGVILAPPSRQTLAAPIQVGDLPRRGRDKAMLFRLEEQLPLAAEDIVADFISTDRAALGLAVRRDWLEPL